MQEFIAADPGAFPQNLMFRSLQTLTLNYRLDEPVASLGESAGWLS